MKLAISRTVTNVVDVTALIADIRTDLSQEGTTDDNVESLCKVAEELMNLLDITNRELDLLLNRMAGVRA